MRRFLFVLFFFKQANKCKKTIIIRRYLYVYIYIFSLFAHFYSWTIWCNSIRGVGVNPRGRYPRLDITLIPLYPHPRERESTKPPLFTVPLSQDKHWHFGTVVRMWRPHMSASPAGYCQAWYGPRKQI